MGWSCELLGKNNVDLLKKYDIHYRLVGLAPYGSGDTPASYELSYIRSVIGSNEFSDKYKKIAQSIFENVKDLIRTNLLSVDNRRHCETCTCINEQLEGWDLEMINRFLSIPVDEVYKFHGGY